VPLTEDEELGSWYRHRKHCENGS